MFDTNKKLSHKSWTENGTHVTNFSSKELLRYGKAIEIYEKQKPKHGLIISAFAWGFNDTVHLENYCSLHHIITEESHFDLSDFWRIYDSLNDNVVQAVP